MAHRRGSRDVVTDDVTDDDADGPVRQVQQVVEVAADVGRGRGADVVGGRLDAGDGGQLGQQGPLQRVGDRVLLLVEPDVVHRERGAPARSSARSTSSWVKGRSATSRIRARAPRVRRRATIGTLSLGRRPAGWNAPAPG